MLNISERKADFQKLILEAISLFFFIIRLLYNVKEDPWKRTY